MAKIKKHIEIVSSADSRLSSMSRTSREAIYEVLNRHYTQVGISLISTPEEIQALVTKKPDLVFLGMKYVPKNAGAEFVDDDKIWLADYFDTHGIATTGSPQSAHELELNKDRAKHIVHAAGLKTSPYHMVSQDQLLDRNDMKLTFPLFVKPANRGGGVGIDNYSVVHNFEALDRKIASVTIGLGSDALIEEYLTGREFSVAILKDEYSDEYTAMPIELIAPINEYGDRLLSGDVKTADTEENALVLDAKIKDKISILAIEAFKALGGRDYGRIDIRMDEAGAPHFLEANLIPSLIGNYGNFHKACYLNIGLEYEPMLLQLVRMSLKRSTINMPEVEEPYISTDNLLQPVI